MPLSMTAEEARESAPNLGSGPEVEETSLLDQLGAVHLRENVLVSAGKSVLEPQVSSEFEPVIDVENFLLPGEELMLSEFALAKTESDMEAIRGRIHRENEIRRMIEEGPMNSFLATTIAVLDDPTTYFPVLGLLGKAKAGRRALQFAAAGGVGVSISEVGLQATQQTRTIKESIAAIIMGGAFGAGIGGIAAGLSKVKGRKAVVEYNKRVKELTDRIDEAEARDPSTVGAAEVETMTPDDTKLASTFGVAEFQAMLLRRFRLISPDHELLTSPFHEARKAILKLAGNSLFTRGMMRGRGPTASLETLIKMGTNAAVNDMARIVVEGLRAHAKNAGRRISRNDFYEEVGKWMNKDEISPDPAVAATVARLRKDILQPMTDKAIAEGLLPKEVTPKTAPRYFSRVYSREMIKAHKAEFITRIETWLREVIPEEQLAGDFEYQAIATDITNTILGNPAGRVPFINVPRVRGPTAARTLLISDAALDAPVGATGRGFLEKNVMEVMTRFLRTLGADVEFQRMFKTTTPGKELGERIQTEADAAIAKATSEKQKVRLQDRATRDIALVKDVANLLRGVSEIPEDAATLGVNRVLKTARDLNFMRLLGMVTLSSSPDPGIIVLNEGLLRTVGPLIRDMATGFKGVKMGIAEARSFGTATDMLTGDRVRSTFDLGERFVTETKLERAVDEGTTTFANFTLINRWNTMMKGITSMVVSTRILTTVERLAAGKTVSKGDLERLGRSRITGDDIAAIAEQGKHWERQNGLVFGNAEAWTGPRGEQARRAYGAAVVSDVDNTIITPGVGDAPIWTSKPFGKTVFQFKKFAMASNQRILLSGLQRRDMAALNGLLAMVGLGMMSTYLRDVTSTGGPRERSTEQWIVEAVDRSGVASLFFEADALTEKFLAMSPTKLITGEPVSRFAARGRFSQLLGPTAGLVEDTSDAIINAFRRDFTNSDVTRFRRLIPYQNHFATRYLVDQLQRGATQAIGLPEKQSRRPRKRLKASRP